MKPALIAWLAAAIGIMMALPLEASAQMFKEPFSFKNRGGAGESVGMSTAHRQLILERELLGRTPDNPVIRDLSGALLEVERRNGGQAFVRAQESPFLVEAASGRLGFGLSSSYGQTGSSGLLLSPAGTNRVMANWIMSLMGGDGYRGVYPSMASSSSASIDQWIDQLQIL